MGSMLVARPSRCAFGDGSIAEASVLVAADGVNSAVRKQFLPYAEPIDTGVIALAGKVPLTDGVLALAPDRLLDGPALVLASQPASLFMAIWKQSRASSEILFRLESMSLRRKRMTI
jgi:2-polyprenyl-6-methoxyphenol hydroxylase-like FAD-dependent oxidoreductase